MTQRNDTQTDPVGQELRRFLGELELAIMELVWQRETSTVRDILMGLRPKRELAYTTVMTVMHRLTEKGLLLQEKRGKTHYYRAAHSREEYASQMAAQIVRSLIADFGEIALVQFVKEVEAADPAQLDQLEQLAKAARRDHAED